MSICSVASLELSLFATATNLMTSVWPPASASAVYLRGAAIGCVPGGSSVPCGGAGGSGLALGSPAAPVHGPCGRLMTPPAWTPASSPVAGDGAGAAADSDAG